MKEIILVDDKSTLEHLGDQLEKYVKTLPVPVKVVRMEERFGIVKARLRGADYSTVRRCSVNLIKILSNFLFFLIQGEVITFFDSHIECGGLIVFFRIQIKNESYNLIFLLERWLEPLLSRIAENRRIVAIPVIDIINDHTFAYTAANIKLYGGCDWKLYYKW